jgi:hypothetical protein
MAILDDGLKILGEIGANAQNLELLLKYLDRLVPFVGADFSLDFRYPSWSKLLQDLADQAGVRSQLDGLLANNQFEEAAEALAAFPNLMDDAIRRTFDHHKLPRPVGKARHATWRALSGGPPSQPTSIVCSKLPLRTKADVVVAKLGRAVVGAKRGPSA